MSNFNTSKTLPREKTQGMPSTKEQQTTKSSEKIESTSPSMLSKITGRKGSDPSKKASLIPNRKDRKAVHVQPHFNMKLIEEIVKPANTTSDESSSLPEVNKTVESEQKDEVHRESEPAISNVATALNMPIVTVEKIVSKQPSQVIERSKTLLKTKTDTDIVSIIDELNNLAQHNHTEKNKYEGQESDFADQFLKKLSYLTDSLVQPKLDAVKFVSGNLQEYHDDVSVEVLVNDSNGNISINQMEEMFNKQSDTIKSADQATLRLDRYVDEETMTDDLLHRTITETEVQTDDILLRQPMVDQESQTDTLLVMSNALVGQLWKLNEALTIKVKEYDDAMIKQNETVDELRERNKVLWNELRLLKTKGSNSELFQQTTSRKEQTLTLVRRREDSKPEKVDQQQ